MPKTRDECRLVFARHTEGAPNNDDQRAQANTNREQQ
jgi:hypothetical protein